MYKKYPMRMKRVPTTEYEGELERVKSLGLTCYWIWYMTFSTQPVVWFSTTITRFTHQRPFPLPSRITTLIPIPNHRLPPSPKTLFGQRPWRGRCPVEQGANFRTSVRPYVRPPPPRKSQIEGLWLFWGVSGPEVGVSGPELGVPGPK